MGKVVMPRLTRGNAKLGKGIWGWSIPAGETCPGRSAACDVCYAMRGQYRRPNVIARHQANLKASRSPHFARRMNAVLADVRPDVVRIHVAGDFYSVPYTDAWGVIIASNPRVRFYAYSRSWRVGCLSIALASLAALPNLRLWFSADEDTGMPADLPSGVRVAYLQQRTGEDVGAAELVFRDRAAQQVPARRIGLTLVCPVESNTKAADTTCTKCRYCWYQ